ncbi:MAG: prepilin-type N-terminal cleavage/methylation domain-containing protein [Candidatus Omnitrophota bacterium]
MTILRTGAANNRYGFTLVEVLVAVTILAVGMVGVISAYISLMNGITASGFTVDSVYLLKDRMADIEKEAIENLGPSSGVRNGLFGEDYPAYRWKTEVSDVMKEADKSEKKAGVKGAENEIKETLCQISVVVSSGAAPSARNLSLYTYLGKYAE